MSKRGILYRRGDPFIMSTDSSSPLLVLEPREYFSQMVEGACVERSIETSAHVKHYLVDLLSHFIFSNNLWLQKDASGKKTKEMLAVTLLSAQQSEPLTKIKKLKELGDHSLYMSGFFPDFFQRKIVDIDYYVDMGRTAYDSLAQSVDEDTFSALYGQIAKNFLKLVDVLGLISQQAMLNDEQNILRLMDVYAKTGSARAGEKLVALGLFQVESQNLFKKKQ